MKERTMLLQRILLPLILLITSLSLALAIPIARGANVDESSFDVTLYIDVTNGVDNWDNDTGSSGKPFKYAYKAFARAETSNAAGNSVHIVIRPGIYRPEGQMANHANMNLSTGAKPIVIEPETPGTVVFTGADIHTNWEPVAGTVYSHSWTSNWGVCRGELFDDAFSSGTALDNMNELGLRREIVVVNNTMLTQVLYSDFGTSPPAGAFCVFDDPATGKVYINPGTIVTNANITNNLIEMATTPGTNSADYVVWQFASAYGLVIRDITFRHYATPVRGLAIPAISIRDTCSNVLIDSCRVYQNNGSGIDLGCRSATMTNCLSVSNGFYGMGGGSGNSNLLFIDSEASFNCWRAPLAGYSGWAFQGIKTGLMWDASYVRMTANSNFGQGLWLDTGHSNVALVDCVAISNRGIGSHSGCGLYIENNQGPIEVIGGTFIHNRVGIRNSGNSNLYIAQNLIASNTTAQIGIMSYFRAAADAQDPETLGTVNNGSFFCRDMKIISNTILCSAETQTLIENESTYATNYKKFYDTYTADYNVYYNPGTSNDMFPGIDGTNVVAISYAEWITNRGQDAHSTWGYAGLSWSVEFEMPLSTSALYEYSNMTVTADASVTPGTISRAVFYAGTNLLEEVTSSPFTLTWSNVPMGRHTLSLYTYNEIGMPYDVITRSIAVSPEPGVTGRVYYEYWTNVEGESVSNIENASSFPLSPSGNGTSVSCDIATNGETNYASRMMGYVHPAETGEYTFFLSGGGEAALYVSTSYRSNEKVKVLSVTQGEYHSTNTASSGILLAAGERYYFEAIQKRGTNEGTNHLTLYWQKQGDSAPSILAGTFVSPYIINDIFPPDAPTGVAAMLASPTSAEVIWDESTDYDIAGYVIHRGTASNFTPSESTRVATSPLYRRRYTDSGLSSGTYYYAVTAYDDASNESSASASARVVVNAQYEAFGTTSRIANAGATNAYTFTLYTGATGEKRIGITICSLEGAIVRDIRTTVDETTESTTWDMTDNAGALVPQGVYVYSIIIKQGTLRFQKQGVIVVVR